jgi:hypothetical protein
MLPKLHYSHRSGCHEAYGSIAVEKPSSECQCYLLEAKPGNGNEVPCKPVGTGRARFIRATWVLLAIVIIFLLSAHSTLLSSCRDLVHPVARSITSSFRNESSLLEVFEVYPPVLTVTSDGVFEITDGSSDATVKIIGEVQPSCTEELAVYSFANSYGHPFVGQYTPPSCTFNRVTWNLTVVTAGRQYDRLGMLARNTADVYFDHWMKGCC